MAFLISTDIIFWISFENVFMRSLDNSSSISGKTLSPSSSMLTGLQIAHQLVIGRLGYDNIIYRSLSIVYSPYFWNFKVINVEILSLKRQTCFGWHVYMNYFWSKSCRKGILDSVSFNWAMVISLEYNNIEYQICLVEMYLFCWFLFISNEEC